MTTDSGKGKAFEAYASARSEWLRALARRDEAPSPETSAEVAKAELAADANQEPSLNLDSEGTLGRDAATWILARVDLDTDLPVLAIGARRGRVVVTRDQLKEALAWLESIGFWTARAHSQEGGQQ